MAETTGVNTQNQAYSSTKTNRGTKIVKAGGELDKNAFLQILAAELTNQDPLSGGKDGSVVRVNVNVGKIKLEDGTEVDDIRQFMYSSIIEVVETPKGSQGNVETPDGSEEENEDKSV